MAASWFAPLYVAFSVVWLVRATLHPSLTFTLYQESEGTHVYSMILRTLVWLLRLMGLAATF
jgi:hypothetical protein